MTKNETMASSINRHCLCQTLDKTKLKEKLINDLDSDLLINERVNLFSNTAVYISSKDLKKIETITQSIEFVIHSKEFQDFVLKDAPQIAINDFGPKGVFMGLDFHLTENGPKLIEINTNAGGGLLNLILAKAQVACCEGVKQPFDLPNLENDFFKMFLSEWTLQKGSTPLKCIAIIDENPEAQYLFPEFQLFSKLFKKFGIESLILDPKDLTLEIDGLWHGKQKVDLLYNRLTDFYLEDIKNIHLKEAYLSGGAVVTPNPHHHALYANKINLETLSNVEILAKMGIASEIMQILGDAIPRTVKLNEFNKDSIWKDRRKYFFKPAFGFGSKAAYRGDKITLKVWGEINNLQYVAQEIAQPGLRIVQVGDEQNEMKLDIRAYAYNGKIQLIASRLYSGQTTNFRTQGGGFAPVFLI
ncbi:MAG TPA: hypothetical protein VNJ01_13965 [Bacteriovoracaceae bacterium]|nr:hypothetical protein [Bacteriovoracaceae bacterium]